MKMFASLNDKLSALLETVSGSKS